MTGTLNTAYAIKHQVANQPSGRFSRPAQAGHLVFDCIGGVECVRTNLGKEPVDQEMALYYNLEGLEFTHDFIVPSLDQQA